jgi:hypothetical protein
MTARVGRLPLLAAALLSMAYGVWMGLLRVGWILPLPWPDQLNLHGPLMIGGFLGTLIGLERAIGISKRWAYLAPIFSALGASVLVFGPPGPLGPLFMAAASAIVATVLLTIVRRQPSLFVSTMVAGTVCWLVGNLGWLAGAAIFRVVFWWVAFVVLTIAGERLELNRLLRPTTVSRALFVLGSATVIAGAALLPAAPTAGARTLGAGLLAVSFWLAGNDVARRTIRQHGLTRYMAACLLAGYMWLAVAGFLLITTAATSPGTSYDAILHAIFVGFVVSMIFGHAPVVFPAVLGKPLPYRSIFYVQLVLLHVSVAARIVGDLIEELGRLRAWGALGNATAILLFVVTTVGSLTSKNVVVRETA